MKQIQLNKEQARQFAVDVYDVLIKDITEQDTHTDAKISEERGVAQ